jgi:Domain of unknown function (DUF1816)
MEVIIFKFVLMKITNIWSNLLNGIGLAWWVKITTQRPHCIYYFGPFASAIAAGQSKVGYVEDLENELAQGIEVAIERCRPAELTIDYEFIDRGTDRQLNPLPT